jgi:hypothetical protein
MQELETSAVSVNTHTHTTALEARASTAAPFQAFALRTDVNTIAKSTHAGTAEDK